MPAEGKCAICGEEIRRASGGWWHLQVMGLRKPHIAEPAPVPVDVPKSEPLLSEFAAYCKANPSLRFWQALRAWSGQDFIYASTGVELVQRRDGQGVRDTFYWTTKDGR